MRIAVTKDNSIVLVDNEWTINAGGQGRIRIKGNQHLVAMMFDRAALQGRIVQSATLVCTKGDADIPGLTISTVQCDWDEMKSNSLTAGMPGVSGWGYAGARFPALSGGNAFSLVCQAPSVVQGGQYRWEVAPDLVHAIALGAAYGLALQETSCDYSRNPTIFSREQSGKAPYLEVTFGDSAREPPPEPPTDLKLAALDPNDPASYRLTLRAPKHGFIYEIMVNGEPLPRWNIPAVRPGEVQVIPIRDYAGRPGTEMQVTVAVLNRIGTRSATVSVTSPGLDPKPAPYPDVPAIPVSARPADGLAAIPAEDKYDAAGKPVGDLPPDYRTRNAVFDGQTIRLAAARGEVVAFQALVQRPAKNAESAAKGDGSGDRVRVACHLPGLRVEVTRALYVECEKGRRIPDPLVPLAASEELALAADEAVPVLVTIFVPFDFKAREVRGTLALSDGRTLPVHLAVRPFAIPREAAFACEMNGYGLPDKAGEFYRLQEIAYDHRVHVNLLTYSHNSTAPASRKSSMDMIMDGPAGDGSRRMNEKRYNDIQPGANRGHWEDFVKTFGPYLSGSYFKDGHRGPVQPPGFYLTFHESWPLKVREFWSGSPDAYETFKAKPVYAETFVGVLKDFLDVARREGWTRTGFQLYLNNKGSMKDAAKAPWTLDEPTDYYDYRALAFFGDLVHQALGPEPGVVLRFRIDISRPEYDRGQLEGKAGQWVVATGAFHDYHRLVADRVERTGERIWIYGTTNKVEETNRTVQAWVLDAYQHGAWGVVPWQTIDRDGAAMTKADQLGLFIFTKGPDGRPVIRHSMRLAAYLRAEQDVEYLELLRKKANLTPRQMQGLIDHYLNLASTVKVAHAEDAGTPQYSKVTPEGLRQLREAAALRLAQP